MIGPSGVLGTATVVTMIGVIALGRLAMSYEKELSFRIPTPRYFHLEYRQWLVLLIFPLIHIAILGAVGSAFLWDLFIIKPHARYTVVPSAPFPEALVYIVVGIAIFVLPLLAFGVYFDRRIRSDSPEAPAGPAEVRSFRRYLVAATAAILLLVVAVSVLIALV